MVERCPISNFVPDTLPLRPLPISISTVLALGVSSILLCRSTMSIRILQALLVFACALMMGCGRGMDRADLVFINGAEAEALDPALSTAQATGRVMYALLEGLTAFDEKGIAQPGVAERWELSPDGKIYTFFFRKNARWSNGDPVTTADFLYSWKRTLLPATACEYAAQFYPVLNARAFNDGKITDFSQVGVRATDAYTLIVELEAPTSYFLDLCAFATLLPVHQATVERHADWAYNARHFVGNGPFHVREWRLFDRLRLVKSPTYWNAAAVKMASIDVLPIEKPMTAFNFYATGQADLLMDKNVAPNQLIGELRKRPDFHAASFLGNYFIRFNATRPPFNDARVRQAFSLTFDKQVITENLTRAGEKPAFSLTPPGTGKGYEPPPGLDRNVAKAKALMSEAGYPDGKGFPTIYYLYRSNLDLDQNMAVEIQSILARDLGVQIQLQKQEWTVFLKSQSNLQYDFCRSTWVADYNDPNTFLEMFTTGNGNNRTGWSDPEYDGWIVAAAGEPNVTARNAIFAKAERRLISESAIICPLYYYVGIQMYDAKRLGGIEPNLLDEHPLKTLYWKDKAP